MTVSWIQTFTGRQVFPLDPKPEQIDVRDIAHALSMVCRYTGHVIKFYSVAEHSVRVAEYLLGTGGERSAELARYGLLHDASEAYICDIARPLKVAPEFAAYREAEARMQGMIYAMHGLACPEPEAVLHADLLMLATERMELLGPEPASWGELPDPLPVQGFSWDPTFAEAMFLQAYNTLFRKR